MKKFPGIFILVVLAVLLFIFVLKPKIQTKENSPVLEVKPTLETVKPTKIPVDYSSFTFEALSKRKIEPGKIKLGKIIAKKETFTSYLFTYQSEGKIISGMANIPKGSGKHPVVILLRGYADKTYYYSGLGTEKSANFLAEKGFLTLAPDFLGYGASDLEDEDILKARFYRPVEILSLLSAVDSLPSADSSKIGLWGHSNGGQIALSVLEITQKNFPTSLWAPVSLPFPECILTYLNKEEEVGNIVKEKVDLFLENNDPKKYSTADYLSAIKQTAFNVHQGTWDQQIEVEWTNNLTEDLKKDGNLVEYFTYEKENHNFNYRKTTGEILRQRDWQFFQKYLKETN